MDKLSKPAITRLARRAGVKSLSEDTFPKIRSNIDKILEEFIRTVMIVHRQNKTKVIMLSEVYKALESHGYNVAHSDDLNISTK